MSIKRARFIDFSGISSRTLSGKLLRLPLRLIPREVVLPIVQGKLKGRWWVVGSSSHGCWLGSYELEKQILFVNKVRPASVVFDVGAHVGIYTLLAAELVGNRGKVYAFEPLPRNIRYLTKHIQLNHCQNVRIFPMAVGDKSGTNCFEEVSSSSMGRLSSSGKLRVNVISLDELIGQGDVPLPDYVKIDVEGAELNVLIGAKGLLRESRPTLFLATHGRELHRECCNLLTHLGYELRPITGNDVSATDEILAEARP